MARPVRNAVVVITGASSGIGMAAAYAFAREGARVVVAARRRAIIEEVARECERLGGQALAVPTDVTDEAAMEHLAEAAVSTFGGIDVWINNAGTGVFGPFAEADAALHRKVLEVNLIGAVHGAAFALPTFKRQGRGVLINTVSMGGWMPTPFAAAYTASKFGLRGFNASLRQELDPREDIHVCGVFPAMVDTPGFVHGANVSGRKLDPGPLLYRPEDVAAAMVRLVRHPRGEVSVGWPARAAEIAYNLAPRLTELVVGAVFRQLVSTASPAERTEGAILKPVAVGHEPSGGWLDRKGLPSAGTISAGLAVGMAAAAIAVAAAARSRRRHRWGR